MPHPIILIGAGGHAAACIDVIEQEGKYEVSGLIGLPNEIGKKIFGHPIIGCDADIPKLLNQNSTVLITIGQIKTVEPRLKLFMQMERIGCCMPIIVSPSAYVSPYATIGPGTIIMHRVVVNAGVSIGRNCIINSMALLEHDVVIEDHCHISTACVINGNTKVGTRTFIGSGCNIRQSLQIGRNCLLGMGQVVVKNCSDYTIFEKKKINPA